MLVAIAACARQQAPAGPPPGGTTPAPWLAAWTGSADTAHRAAFLAIVDLKPGSPTRGQVVRVVQAGPGSRGTHHTEHFLQPDGLLFADDFGTGRSYIFDLTDPARASIHASFTTAGPFGWPHSYVRLPNGNRLITYQWQATKFDRPPGGLAEVRTDGSVVRWSAARAAGVPDSEITPYSLEVLPDLDRVVSTSTSMIDSTGVHVQVWRLSDLALLHTLRIPSARPHAMDPAMPMGDAMPRHLFPGEPRTLADGKTVMLATFNCGMYMVTGLETAGPAVVPVYAFPGADCAVPLRMGHWWVQTVPELHAVVVLDISRPAEPREASRLAFGDSVAPHWLAADPSGRRLVMDTGHDGRLWLLAFDPATGRITPDPELPVVEIPGGIPHGAVFSGR